MLKLYVEASGRFLVTLDDVPVYRGALAGAHAELIWQGVLPGEAAHAFSQLVKNSTHSVAHFGIGKTFICTSECPPQAA